MSWERFKDRKETVALPLEDMALGLLDYLLVRRKEPGKMKRTCFLMDALRPHGGEIDVKLAKVGMSR